VESMNRKVEIIAEFKQSFEDNKNNAIKLIKSAKTVLANFVKFQSVFRCIVGFLYRKENLKIFRALCKIWL